MEDPLSGILFKESSQLFLKPVDSKESNNTSTSLTCGGVRWADPQRELNPPLCMVC